MSINLDNLNFHSFAKEKITVFISYAWFDENDSNHGKWVSSFKNKLELLGYKKNQPSVKSNQIPLEVEQQIVDIAIDNITWGTPHIMHAMRNIGNFQLKPHHVRCALLKNHIPMSEERSKKGLSWKAFVAGLKSTQNGGVIFL